MQTGFKGKRGLNYITTSHQHSTETGMADLFDKQLKNGYTLRSDVHSHPENTPYPSGLNGGSGDIPYAQWITDESKHNPSFKIYLPGKGTYVKFSPNSSPEDFGFGIPTYNLKRSLLLDIKRKNNETFHFYFYNYRFLFISYPLYSAGDRKYFIYRFELL